MILRILEGIHFAFKYVKWILLIYMESVAVEKFSSKQEELQEFQVGKITFHILARKKIACFTHISQHIF